MLNKSLPQVEVSAICNHVAISPDGSSVYVYSPVVYSSWIKLETHDAFQLWNFATDRKKVHRGIFKIRVVED